MINVDNSVKVINLLKNNKPPDLLSVFFRLLKIFG
jgi:hypothetical protein